MRPESMTYEGVGVNYDAMDPFKRAATEAARATADNIRRLGFRVVEESYGESAFLIKQFNTAQFEMAHVEEGLGTKNLVADTMHILTGKSYYDHIAQDTVAMIVNDMATLGALPLSVAMHLAVGNSNWFKDERRTQDLIAGWQKACNLARCAWGGGETPTLKGIIMPDAAVLSGSATGIIRRLKLRIKPDRIQAGDAIVLIASSGIHANGLTMARAVADSLLKGYMTELPDGRAYGEALLDPTHIYVGLVEDCLNAGVDIHYAVNITGHGWRKLMRATQPFSYIIEHLPPQPLIFGFLQEHGPMDDREAYGNLNMGAGFALYVPEADMPKVWSVLHEHEHINRLKAVNAGHIEAGEKKVVIRPKGIEYRADTLCVR